MNELSIKEATELKLTRIQEDNRRKVEEMEQSLPHVIEVRREITSCSDARQWCREHFGEPRMRIGTSTGVWSCANYMSYIPYNTFRFAEANHAIEFKLMFG